VWFIGHWLIAVDAGIAASGVEHFYHGAEPFGLIDLCFGLIQHGQLSVYQWIRSPVLISFRT
jgi:hypothetical protein